MAPIDLHRPASLLPLFLVISHLIGAAWITFIAARSIYRSYIALPPAAATRHRQHHRKNNVLIFSALSLISLASAGYFAFEYSNLSYQVWASERGIGLPAWLYGGTSGIKGPHDGRFHIVQWLNDTPFYRDAFEVVAEKARHFWWGQQISLGLVAWSMYLAIEGQRRNITNLWAFLALSQLVNLSFAQNLFFLAILVTPVRLPGNVRQQTRTSVPGTSSRLSQLIEKLPTKSEGFVPNPGFYYTLLAASFTSIFLIPFATNTSSFTTIMALSRLLPFSFLALPYIIPKRCSTVATEPHSSYGTYTKIFKTISILSGLMMIKTSFLAVFYNMPSGPVSYRHSFFHPFQEEHLSTIEQVTSAAGRIMNAIYEHPAATAVGWDVLLSGLSLAIWATIRASDMNQMLKSALPFLPIENIAEVAKLKAEREEREDRLSMPPPPTTRRGPGRPRKHADESTPEAPYVPTLRERTATEGDEDIEENIEMGVVAWGLLIIGGLGIGTSGVCSAEVTRN